MKNRFLMVMLAMLAAGSLSVSSAIAQDGGPEAHPAHASHHHAKHGHGHHGKHRHHKKHHVR